MADAPLQVSIEGLTPELLRFYQRNPLDRGQHGGALLDWTFADTERPFAVMRKAGEIVGLSAYIRTRFKLGAHDGAAYQAVDSFVSESARGRGIFGTLARHYSDHAAQAEADVLWGFPNPNAAPAWFGPLGWTSHGQVPLMVRPLRAGWMLRRLGLGGDFRTISSRDLDLPAVRSTESWMDDLWKGFSAEIGCAVVRDAAYVDHRLFRSPESAHYRVVGSTEGVLVATRSMNKHGGRIAYLMEAMGQGGLESVLRSELARLCDRGTELVLAWAFPWSPNHAALRSCGFIPIPAMARPAKIWFGARSYSRTGLLTEERTNWYLSYLDSDTI